MLRKGANMLHCALLILLNDSIHRKAKLMMALLQPMRIFHGQQVVQCHSPAGNREWVIGMSSGSFVVPLIETWRVFGTSQSWRPVASLSPQPQPSSSTRMEQTQ